MLGKKVPLCSKLAKALLSSFQLFDQGKHFLCDLDTAT